MTEPKKSGIIKLENTDNDETIALADAVKAEEHASLAVKAGKGWTSAYGKMTEAARVVAGELLAIRQTFQDRRGTVDYNGSSRSYVAFIGERVFARVFGPEYGPATPGYNSFSSTVRREVKALREERSKLDKSDPLYFPTAAQSGSAGTAQAAAAKTDVQMLREHVSAIASGRTKTFGSDPMHSAQAVLSALDILLDALKRPAVKLDPKTVGAIIAEMETVTLRTAEVGLILDIRTDNGGNLPDESKTDDESTDETPAPKAKTERKTA